MNIDFKKLGAAAAAAGIDMTKSVGGGGGDYTPPAEGPCRLRLVGYVEVGKHERKIKGVPKVENQVLLVFELSGKNHEPRDVNGEKVPYRITVKLNLSLNEKATFFKLFQRMNYAGDASHMVQLLGRPFLGTVYHRKWKGTDGKERVEAELSNKADGFSIRPPRRQNEDDEWVPVEVAPALSELRAFIWQLADEEQWASLFIDGEYPARTDDKGEVVAKAKSKNVFQNTIRSAMNFEGSPIAAVLAGKGIGKLDLPDVDTEDGPDEEPQQGPVSDAGADPLAGVV